MGHFGGHDDTRIAHSVQKSGMDPERQRLLGAQHTTVLLEQLLGGFGVHG